MVKKKTTTAKPAATFEVRFLGSDVLPEKIPLRSVSDALSAVQDLASARDSFEETQVSPEKSIRLLAVRRGSATYQCLARAPREAIANLVRVAAILASLDDEHENEDGLVAAFRPLKSLCDVAGSVGCSLQVRLVGRETKELFTVQKEDYQRISDRLFMTGETTVVGVVERVGGATGMRCLLRVPGRTRLLYCDVESEDLVRRLGQHLYEQIAATGTATWIHRSWRIHEFKIKDFTQPRLGNLIEALTELRNAGLSAWDDITDPETFIQGLR
jgi:hypothetical protein